MKEQTIIKVISKQSCYNCQVIMLTLHLGSMPGFFHHPQMLSSPPMVETLKNILSDYYKNNFGHYKKKSHYLMILYIH